MNIRGERLLPTGAGNAAVNAPHSKRWRDAGSPSNLTKRLEGGGFSTASALDNPRTPVAPDSPLSVSAIQRFSRNTPVALFALMLLLSPTIFTPAQAAGTFADAVAAYRSGQFIEAAQAFRDAAAQSPASGTFVNLGLTEWRRGRAGAAILAWEQALWIDPYDARARGNLEYARRFSTLESPALTWYERASTWLPVNAWAWLAGGSLWLAVGMMTLPGVLRRRRTGLQQAFAALGLGVFLLCLPAHIGVNTRTQIGFILQKNTPLRLTPTREADVMTRLAAGEAARKLRQQGEYVLVSTANATGWVEREQFGLICPR